MVLHEINAPCILFINLFASWKWCTLNIYLNCGLFLLMRMYCMYKIVRVLYSVFRCIDVYAYIGQPICEESHEFHELNTNLSTISLNYVSHRYSNISSHERQPSDTNARKRFKYRHCFYVCACVSLNVNVVCNNLRYDIISAQLGVCMRVLRSRSAIV